MGLIGLLLNQQVKKIRDESNQYNANLEMLRRDLENAKKAKKLYEDSAEIMDDLIFETEGVFSGEAAMAFVTKLNRYNSSVRKMVPFMNKRIKACEKRISEIEEQKKSSDFWANAISDMFSLFSFF